LRTDGSRVSVGQTSAEGKMATALTREIVHPVKVERHSGELEGELTLFVGSARLDSFVLQASWPTAVPLLALGAELERLNRFGEVGAVGEAIADFDGVLLPHHREPSEELPLRPDLMRLGEERVGAESCPDLGIVERSACDAELEDVHDDLGKDTKR
jgi:hypothetical protein